MVVMDAVLNIKHGGIQYEEVYLEAPPGTDRAGWLGLVVAWLDTYGIKATYHTNDYGLLFIEGRRVACGYGDVLRCWFTPDFRGQWAVIPHRE